MDEVVAYTDWKQIPYETRIHINGPTTAIYSLTNLPDVNDSGWSDWVNDQGQVFRLINIHGPFSLTGREEKDRCEDGWLGVNSNGTIITVESKYVKSSPSSLDERARPVGFTEAT